MRNRFSGRCRTCRSEVEPDHGELEGERGSWQIVCDTCLAARRANVANREAELVEQAQAQGARIVPRARLRTVAVQEAEERATARQAEVDARNAQQQESARQAAVAANALPRPITRRGRGNPILAFNAQPDEVMAVVESMDQTEQDSIFGSLFRRRQPVRRQDVDAVLGIYGVPVTRVEQPQLSTEDRAIAQNYHAQGYRVISKSKMVIARIDKPDWKYHEMIRGFGRAPGFGQMTKEDFYRRNASQDKRTLTNKLMLSVIGSSTLKAGQTEPGFVNIDPNWKPEKKVKRRGMEL